MRAVFAFFMAKIDPFFLLKYFFQFNLFFFTNFGQFRLIDLKCEIKRGSNSKQRGKISQSLVFQKFIVHEIKNNQPEAQNDKIADKSKQIPQIVELILNKNTLTLLLREQVSAGTKLIWLICSPANPRQYISATEIQKNASISLSYDLYPLNSKIVLKLSKIILAMYQGFLCPMRVLHLSEQYPMRGVAMPSTTWPIKMASVADSTKRTFLRKQRRQLNQHVAVRSLRVWPMPYAQI